MATYGDKFRHDAQQERAAAKVLLEAMDFDSDRKKQLAATVGFVTANMLDAIGDLTDLLKESQRSDPLMERRKEFMQRSDAIRRSATAAFATGDWSEFDKLTGATGEIPDVHGS